MFEGQPQAELDAILKSNNEFKQLYQRHKELDRQVLDAELGVLPIDDVTLARMKREKLHIAGFGRFRDETRSRSDHL